ncbi:uncharacterized protein LOC129282023 [Lytechinus pictus]|uniref:uncharacterized protein LOC129282023 n=1 Tax=Lytechinus pictus TaxID=7653 RepID=UPI0030B9D6B9
MARHKSTYATLDHDERDEAIKTDINQNQRMKDRMAEPDIFGVQLEVTSRLLDAEKRRLQVLSKELRSKQPDVVQEYQDARKQRDFERRKAYLARLQLQHDVLEREFRDAALGMYKRYHRGAKVGSMVVLNGNCDNKNGNAGILECSMLLISFLKYCYPRV